MIASQRSGSSEKVLGPGCSRRSKGSRMDATQTMAFGDYLNDLELLDAAAYSFAMDNAHPEVRARARYVAPANTRNGVARTIASVLGIALTA